MSLFIGILTVILIITSIFLVLVVLMQRAKTDSGMGAAMGGGSMESAFGAETSNVLTGATIKASIVFFVISFALYLAHIYQAKHQEEADNRLPTVNAPAAAPASQPVAPVTAPATQAPTPPTGESTKP